MIKSKYFSFSRENYHNYLSEIYKKNIFRVKDKILPILEKDLQEIKENTIFVNYTEETRIFLEKNSTMK